MVAAHQRAEPTKWLTSARTSHDAHGVGLSRSSGRTLVKMARVPARAWSNERSICCDLLLSDPPTTRQTWPGRKRNRCGLLQALTTRTAFPHSAVRSSGSDVSKIAGAAAASAV